MYKRNTMKKAYKHGPKTQTQAALIIAKFGGAYRLADALALAAAVYSKPEYTRSVTSIYRWMYPAKKKGSHGRIPPHDELAVRRAAAVSGIYIGEGDWAWRREPTKGRKKP